MKVAQLNRIAVFLLLAANAGWIAVFVARGLLFFAMVGLPLTFFGCISILLVEYWFVLSVGDFPNEPTPTWKELASALLAETIVAAQVFFWRQPFRHDAVVDSWPCSPNEKRGVLLVHGLGCNRAFWNPWLSALKRRGVGFVAVTLEPPFCDIERHAASIEAAFHSLALRTGNSPTVVGHSMGGLAVRHWLSLESSSQFPPLHVVTIGTPHHGTWLARFSGSEAARQMMLDSDWLRGLERRSTALTRHKFVCFYGNADNVVIPASGARLPGADNHLIRGTGHIGLAFKAQVYDEVLRSIDT